ncbi:MAG: hypothetical protein HKN40_14350 [Winogradskyella sp.]|uniref:hypothetical protein n=1 Tax=Winogradskyella sp. TaxID=1883156 RepID=UPI0017CAE486|nr:hypothetical protein [Winogradskyella sp.]
MKEKAQDLVDRFKDIKVGTIDQGRVFYVGDALAKQCALICVDEILDALYEMRDAHKKYNYWQRIKKEIENL